MNKIFEVKFGSHLYGTNNENSDTDYKGIYIPTAREICLNSYKKTICSSRPKQVGERNTKDDVDVEFFSLDQFLKLLCEGQTVALDMLFSSEFRNTDWVIEKEYNHCYWHPCKAIWAHKDKLINKNINAFVGYTKQQAAKYGVKGFRVHALKLVCELFEVALEEGKWLGSECVILKDIDLEKIVADWNNSHIKIITDMDKNCYHQKFLEVCDKKMPFHLTIKEAYSQCKKRYDAYGHRALMAQKNEGIDWKALSHAVRIASEAVELLETGFITFPRPDKELLIKIKTGQLPYDQVSEIIERGLENIKLASEKSSLNESPDKVWCEEFIYKVYKEVVVNEV